MRVDQSFWAAWLGCCKLTWPESEVATMNEAIERYSASQDDADLARGVKEG